jgi:exosome complex exonuclease DIS3/RRP44
LWKYACLELTSELLFLAVESYVKSLGQPALLDLLVQPASEDVIMEEVEDMRPSKRKVVYPEVLL